MANRITYVIALFGVILTVHLWILKGRGFDQGCLGFSDTAAHATSSECSEVVNSDAGRFLGVDNVVLGFLFYVLVGTLSLGRVFSRDSLRKALSKSLLSLVSVGFLMSLYFVYTMLFVLKATCPLCITSAVFITALLGLQVLDTLRTQETVKVSAELAVKELGLFAIFSFIAAALLVGDTFFVNRVGTLSLSQQPQAGAVRALAASVLEERIDAQYLTAMAPCSYAPDVEPIADFQSLLSSNPPFVGNAHSPVVVLEVFDPNCPHCRRLHPILQNVVNEYKNRVAFYFKPFPLWAYSVQQIEAIWLAAREGKAFEMIDAQFAQQRHGGLTTEQISNIAAEIGLSLPAFESGLRDGTFRNQVLQFKEQLREVGIHSAPKLLINGRLVGAKGQTLTESCIGKLLQKELEKS